MATIAIRHQTATGTQGVGHEYLLKVTSLFGAVADELRPYFGPVSLNGLDDARGGLKDRTALEVDVVRLVTG